VLKNGLPVRKTHTYTVLVYSIYYIHIYLYVCVIMTYADNNIYGTA
jgi:hypothetical protein